MIDTVVRERWERMRDRLSSELPENHYDTWFARTSVLGLERGTLMLGVPNMYVRQWIEDHHRERLERIASDEMGVPLKVALQVDAEAWGSMTGEGAEAAAATAPLDPEGASRPRGIAEFIRRPGVRSALMAIEHTARRTEPNFGPLLVLGEEGTGKSHLAQALAEWVPEGTEVCLTSGERFAADYQWQLKRRQVEAFRLEIATSGLVVIDDLTALAGKPATQRELGRMLEDQQARGGRVIAFAATPPGDTKDFDPKLASLIGSGLVVTLEAPRPDEALVILETVLGQGERPVPVEVIRAVTARVPGSVSRLERIVRKTWAFAGLTGQPVDDAFLDANLGEIAGPTAPEERRFELLLDLVEEHFEVERAELLSKRKTKRLTTPRALVVWLLRERSSLTFKEIGERLGGRSHTSVYLMHKKLLERLPGEPELNAFLREASRRMMTAG